VLRARVSRKLFAGALRRERDDDYLCSPRCQEEISPCWHAGSSPPGQGQPKLTSTEALWMQIHSPLRRPRHPCRILCYTRRPNQPVRSQSLVPHVMFPHGAAESVLEKAVGFARVVQPGCEHCTAGITDWVAGCKCHCPLAQPRSPGATQQTSPWLVGEAVRWGLTVWQFGSLYTSTRVVIYKGDVCSGSRS